MMDFVKWCDGIAAALADYAENQPTRLVNVQRFATHLLDDPLARDGYNPRYDSVVQTAAEMLEPHGLGHGAQSVTLLYSEIEELREAYDRWVEVAKVMVGNEELLLLSTLNRLSVIELPEFATVRDVSVDTILTDSQVRQALGNDRPDRLEERLYDLAALGLARDFRYKRQLRSTYRGVTRTTRSDVADNTYLDLLRTAGEGDALDYKRTYPLSSDSDKHKLAKDVCAFANAGGSNPRVILVGVEDDGQFFLARSSQEEEAHKRQLMSMTETRLQEIVSARSAPSPSIRVKAGTHRDGPYVLIEINRDVANLPYRTFRSPGDKRNANAEDVGEVWIRKGSTNGEATALEVEGLKRQATLYLNIRSIK